MSIIMPKKQIYQFKVVWSGATTLKPHLGLMRLKSAIPPDVSQDSDVLSAQPHAGTKSQAVLEHVPVSTRSDHGRS